MALGTKVKSPQALERNRQNYLRRLDDKATPPSQRAYALSMLRMTEAALKESLAGRPLRETDGDDVVDLHPDEWSSKSVGGSAMPDAVVTIHASCDEDANVWFVESSDLHGVNAQAETLDALMAKLPAVVCDLMDTEDTVADRDITLDIVAHRRIAVRVRRSA